MIFVFHPFAPAPAAVGSHEEDLSGAKRAGDQQRQRGRIRSRHLCERTRTSLPALARMHGGIPLEAGQSFPDFDVVVLRVGQLGQQAAAAEFGQLEVAGRARAPTAGLRRVEHDRAAGRPTRCRAATFAALASRA